MPFYSPLPCETVMKICDDMTVGIFGVQGLWVFNLIDWSKLILLQGMRDCERGFGSTSDFNLEQR